MTGEMTNEWSLSCCCTFEVLAVQYATTTASGGGTLWLALLDASTGEVLWNINTGVSSSVFVTGGISAVKGIGINSANEILTAIGKFYDLDGNHLRDLTSSIPTLNAAGLSAVTTISNYKIYDLCFDNWDRIYLYDKTFNGDSAAADTLTCAALRFNAAGDVQDRHFYAGQYSATSAGSGGFFYTATMDTAGITLIDPADPISEVVFCGWINRRFAGPTFNTDWQWQFDNPAAVAADQRPTVTSSGTNRSAGSASPFLRHTPRSVRALSTGNVATACWYYDSNGTNSTAGHRLLLTNPGTGVPGTAVDVTSPPFQATPSSGAFMHSVAVGLTDNVYCTFESDNKLVKLNSALSYLWYTTPASAGGGLVADPVSDDVFCGGNATVERFHGASGSRIWQTNLTTELGLGALVCGLAYRRL